MNLDREHRVSVVHDRDFVCISTILGLLSSMLAPRAIPLPRQSNPIGSSNRDPEPPPRGADGGKPETSPIT